MSQRSSGSQHTVTEDERLLQIPPDERRTSFTHTDPWRGLRVMGEIREGVETPSHGRDARTGFRWARPKAGGPPHRKAGAKGRPRAREECPRITRAGAPS